MPPRTSDAAAFDLKPVQELCDELNVPYTVVPTEIGKILFETRQESNPCALCAKMRKGALNEAALKLGCNKIAYAHHRDDLIETMLLSLIYEGRFYSFSPKTHLDKTGLTLIRPLMYVQEADVIGFKNKYHLPVCKNPCPVDGKTKREYVKQLTKKLNHDSLGLPRVLAAENCARLSTNPAQPPKPISPISFLTEPMPLQPPAVFWCCCSCLTGDWDY